MRTVVHLVHWVSFQVGPFRGVEFAKTSSVITATILEQREIFLRAERSASTAATVRRRASGLTAIAFAVAGLVVTTGLRTVPHEYWSQDRGAGKNYAQFRLQCSPYESLGDVVGYVFVVNRGQGIDAKDGEDTNAGLKVSLIPR